MKFWIIRYDDRNTVFTDEDAARKMLRDAAHAGIGGVEYIEVAVGDTFRTPFEEGCIVQSLPDEHGNFDGLDSDGVEVGFNIVMVEEVSR